MKKSTGARKTDPFRCAADITERKSAELESIGSFTHDLNHAHVPSHVYLGRTVRACDN